MNKPVDYSKYNISSVFRILTDEVKPTLFCSAEAKDYLEYLYVTDFSNIKIIKTPARYIKTTNYLGTKFRRVKAGTPMYLTAPYEKAEIGKDRQHAKSFIYGRVGLLELKPNDL